MILGLFSGVLGTGISILIRIELGSSGLQVLFDNYQFMYFFNFLYFFLNI